MLFYCSGINEEFYVSLHIPDGCSGGFDDDGGGLWMHGAEVTVQVPNSLDS